ncbi:hypothetical protein TPHA_0A03570 [Tetrapisispora phaffii CBS 4417]|uniref:Altered inheritance of mitochondria protein 3 n=1 Tax=Tetrapisispora phaffii (strain ATCC 24235 / CBS 4417 / NBRC 1672 / NRRL Y-8282 / UCD 70-5) TaxID=1071381 RepID=G8BNF5_TETPH|nr:hypothetical protein TPHA_0A03570 [Tetrapisispora phaffii CBS 4417]CCE61433.1 hypothetical protein TPHA_0A03570 [Tetrapisispora phaffii CBS 4417]
MSGFWANNKDSIYSGLKTVGKAGYNGTKTVAKTGYSAGKKHYKNSKSQRDGTTKHKDDEDYSGEDEDDNEGYKYTPPPNRLQDPASFPAPPIRAGQKQYGPDGQVIEATTAMGGQFPNNAASQQPLQPQYQQPSQVQQPSQGQQLPQPQYQQPPQAQYQQSPQPQPQYQQPPQPQYQQPPQAQYQQSPQAQYQQSPQPQPQYQQPPQAQYQQPLQTQQPLQVETNQRSVPPPPQRSVQQAQHSVNQAQYKSAAPVGSPSLPQQFLAQPPVAQVQNQENQLQSEASVELPFNYPTNQAQLQHQNLTQPTFSQSPITGDSPQPVKTPSNEVPFVHQLQNQLQNQSQDKLLQQHPVSNNETEAIMNTPNVAVVNNVSDPSTFTPTYTAVNRQVPHPSVYGNTVSAEFVPSADAVYSTQGDASSVAYNSAVNITPYDPSASGQERDSKRINIPSIDTTALPPPPTHKDRGLNTVNSPTAQSLTSASFSQETPRSSPPIKMTDIDIPDELNETLNNSGTSQDAQKSSEEPEVERIGIAGSYDNLAKVNFAPPPRPYNAVVNQDKAPAAPRKINSSATTALQLPQRRTAPSLIRKTDNPITQETKPSNPVKDFLPPPKPYRASPMDSDNLDKNKSGVLSSGDSRLDNKPSFKGLQPPPPSHNISINSLTHVAPEPITASDDGSESTPTNTGIKLSSEIPISNFAPPPKPFRHVSTDPSNDIEIRKTPVLPVTNNSRSRPGKKAPPPLVKPKPKNLNKSLNSEVSTDPENSDSKDIYNKTQSSANSSAIVEDSELSQVLNKMKLKKTGSIKNVPPSANSSMREQTQKKSPPIIPRKKDTLKTKPPVVPAKKEALKLHNDQGSSGKATEFPEDNDDEFNPFQKYLKQAVPVENDRLHK